MMRTNQKKTKVVAFIMVLLLSLIGYGSYGTQNIAYADLVFDPSFETGLSTTTIVDAEISTGKTIDTSGGEGYLWVISPNETQMLSLSPSGGSTYADVKAAFGFSNAGDTYMTDQFPNITDVAYVYADIPFEANESLSMAWQYVSTDYDPFNDGSFISFVNQDDTSSIPLISGVRADVSILGATVLGTGNYSTDSYGSTGWQTVTLKANAAGLYRVGYAVFNLDDTALSPYLFIDDSAGIVTRDGDPFGPIEEDPNAPPPAGDVEESDADGLQTSEGETEYSLDLTPVVVDADLTLDGFTGGDALEAAKVMIRNMKAGDSLTYGGIVANISASYNSDTGILTLLGDEETTQADFQTALRSVKFSTTSNDNTDRIIDFMAGGGIFLESSGHFYEFITVNDPVSWQDAETAAGLLDLYGRQGYLATITSAEENAFIAEKTLGLGWIGGRDISHPGGTSVSDGDWRWVTGPEGTTDSGDGLAFWNGYFDDDDVPAVGSCAAIDNYYNNWVNGEPNNYEQEEYVAHIFGPGDYQGQWNDYSPTNTVEAYIVEYGGMDGDSPLTISDSKTIAFEAEAQEDNHSGGNHNDSQDDGVEVIVNGVTQSAGTQTQSTENGVTTVTVDVDAAALIGQMEEVLSRQTENPTNENIVEVPIISDAEKANVVMPAAILQQMEESNFTLKVTFDNVSYLLPSNELNIQSLAQELGINGNLGDLEIQISISAPDGETLARITEQAQAKEYEIVIPPMTFEVAAVNAETGQEIAISKFVSYVERMFEIPSGIDPGKITTGIVVNADGTFSHIPTEIIKIGDKYYAKLNSMTNSTYSVIWNPVVFTDMEKHWAKDAANNMGSRLVVNGTGSSKFSPDRPITRGEFAAIITKALGIYRTQIGTDNYKDVLQNDIFYDSISISTEYGLIMGYPDGSFQPENTITREEAMAILSRAAEIMKLETANGITLVDFKDASLVSGWAKPYVEDNLYKGIIVGNNSLINPKESISRAEVVTAVERLLKNTELINK